MMAVTYFSFFRDISSSDILFCFVMYIRVTRIIEKEDM